MDLDEDTSKNRLDVTTRSRSHHHHREHDASSNEDTGVTGEFSGSSSGAISGEELRRFFDALTQMQADFKTDMETVAMKLVNIEHQIAEIRTSPLTTGTNAGTSSGPQQSYVSNATTRTNSGAVYPVGRQTTQRPMPNVPSVTPVQQHHHSSQRVTVVTPPSNISTDLTSRKNSRVGGAAAVKDAGSKWESFGSSSPETSSKRS